jgi:hypothetical protein
VEVRHRDARDHQVLVQVEGLEHARVSLPVPAGRLQIGVQVHPRPDLQRIFRNRALGDGNGVVEVTPEELQPAIRGPEEREPDLPREWRREVLVGGCPIEVVGRRQVAQERVRFR